MLFVIFYCFDSDVISGLGFGVEGFGFYVLEKHFYKKKLILFFKNLDTCFAGTLDAHQNYFPFLLSVPPDFIKIRGKRKNRDLSWLFPIFNKFYNCWKKIFLKESLFIEL